MGGIGKTTIAKVAYNFNFADFETCSFLANIREASNEQNGLLHLRNQLLLDICKGEKPKIYNTDETIVKIQNALCTKKILVILDDVDQIEHVDALIGAGDLFLKGSKIIITTRERLPCHQKHKTFRIKELDDHESLQLFCWHAFSEDHPMEGYLELSERVVRYCEGVPLALHVMGSSLFGRNLDFWESALENLKVITDEQVCKIVEMSYKALHEDHDKQLFLMIAWSYVGKDIDDAVKVLEEYDFYSKVGMRTLMDKYLIRVDKENKIVMHPLVHEMATTIIHQETVDSPVKHDFYNSAAAKSESVTCQGSLLYKNDKCGKRKHLDDNEDELLTINEERSSSLIKRLCLGFFSLFENATRITKQLTRGER
ncbi:hypothetical protein OSB04_un001476 [Centaurea solstitialis]|uniref:Uncharacterized protein n=1 Tax=Centaurea solstitialis TaxID=347529 RepID=A0AA38SAQ5_9ASTR|nr:hypothetical protein OSB04_un001476 [Centaurea solstitialis]